MTILIIKVRVLGLESFQVYVNGVFSGQHLSKEMATSKAKAMLQRVAIAGFEGTLRVEDDVIKFNSAA